MVTQPVLEVSDLSIGFPTRQGMVRVLESVSFEVAKGERVGLVGESGSGKSVLALAIMGLVRPPGKMLGGSVRLVGRDLTRLPEEEISRLRGRRIALIPQDASLALTPVLTIGDQMLEVVQRHLVLDRSSARDRCEAVLRRVGLPDPPRIMRSFAHELSGGMKQRVAIALALVCDPELLIADDPTSAVDVTIQAQILDELRRLSEDLRVAVLFIGHDLRVVSSLCSRIIVLYAGQVSEIGPSDRILLRPRHPYTRALIDCTPSVYRRVEPLPTVPGVPSEGDLGLRGCRFHRRCPLALARCERDRPLLRTDGVQEYACWNPLP